MAFYDDTAQITKEAMDNSLKSFAALTKGFQQVASETTDFTKRSYEHQASMFEKLMQSKTLDKSIEIQSDYVKTAYQDWVSQATKMGEIYSDVAKEAYKPFEATMTTAGEKSVETAKKATDEAKKAADTAASKATN